MTFPTHAYDWPGGELPDEPAGYGAPAPVCVLTDEHATCSYGQPVMLIDGIPHTHHEATARGVLIHPEALCDGLPDGIGTPEIRKAIAERRELMLRWWDGLADDAVRVGRVWR
jgi:hypothetical protein